MQYHFVVRPLRVSQNEIERKSCERKGAQSKTGQGGADAEDMVARAISQLQSHEKAMRSAVLWRAPYAGSPTIYVATQVSWLVARAATTPASGTCLT
jgi:hypothetical protein